MDYKERIALAEDLAKIMDRRERQTQSQRRARQMRLNEEATPQEVAEARHQSNLRLDSMRKKIGYTLSMAKAHRHSDKAEFCVPEIKATGHKVRIPWYLKPPKGSDRRLPLAERLDGAQLDWIHDMGLFAANVTMASTSATRHGPRGESLYEGCE